MNDVNARWCCALYKTWVYHTQWYQKINVGTSKYYCNLYKYKLYYAQTVSDFRNETAMFK